MLVHLYSFVVMVLLVVTQSYASQIKCDRVLSGHQRYLETFLQWIPEKKINSWDNTDIQIVDIERINSYLENPKIKKYMALNEKNKILEEIQYTNKKLRESTEKLVVGDYIYSSHLGGNRRILVENDIFENKGFQRFNTNFRHVELQSIDSEGNSVLYIYKQTSHSQNLIVQRASILLGPQTYRVLETVKLNDKIWVVILTSGQ